VRVALLTLSLGLAACSSSPISQYCASLATCAMEECELSPEACEELRIGEQDACEAELKATRDVIATGSSPACTTCVQAMDRYYTCAADIPTCTDFANAQTEDCDGEYLEYVEACSPEVQEACGQGSVPTGTTGEATRDTGEATIVVPSDPTSRYSTSRYSTDTGRTWTITTTTGGTTTPTTSWYTTPTDTGCDTGELCDTGG
jgi:hypothetical protein